MIGEACQARGSSAVAAGARTWLAGAEPLATPRPPHMAGGGRKLVAMLWPELALSRQADQLDPPRRGGERPMGTAAFGGKGFKGSAAVSGERPIGAATCKQ